MQNSRNMCVYITFTKVHLHISIHILSNNVNLHIYIDMFIYSFKVQIVKTVVDNESPDRLPRTCRFIECAIIIIFIALICFLLMHYLKRPWESSEHNVNSSP